MSRSWALGVSKISRVDLIFDRIKGIKLSSSSCVYCDELISITLEVLLKFRNVVIAINAARRAQFDAFYTVEN